MQKDVEKIFIDILSTEMELPLVYGQDKKGNDIPCFVLGFDDALLGKDERLQIAVTELSSVPMSSTSKSDFEQDPPIEIQTVRSLSSIQIDLISQNRDAATRGWEVIAALSSIYSVQQQEKYNFKIFKIPTGFNQTSFAEGASNLKRYTIVINCHIWNNKEKEITSFYTNFTTRVDNEDTIGEPEGLIEIEEGSPAP